MLRYLKKILEKLVTPVPKISPEPQVITPPLNATLVQRIQRLLVDENVNALFYDSVAKLYVMTTYTSTFSDLLEILTAPAYSNRTVSANNIFSYFNGGKVDIQYQLTRIADYIESNKVNSYVQHDLNEICETYDYLLGLKERKHGK